MVNSFAWMPRKKKDLPKIFVIDTSVILFDHDFIHHLEDNDVVIPIAVLEELDTFKKGNDNKNFSAREFTRFLDELSIQTGTLHTFASLGEGKGKLLVEMDENSVPDARAIFNDPKADHRILNVAVKYRNQHPDRKVVLISKDINLRIKAKSIEVLSEDYQRTKVKNVQKLYKGRRVINGLETELIDTFYKQGYLDPSLLTLEVPLQKNEYLILKNTHASALAYYNPVTQQIERVLKESAYGITPRNAEQVFAIHALLNPDVKLITIQGVAGTGKTLLALAAAIEQRKDFNQIYLARPIVPLSNKDIGFLPGDINSKISPYMEPLFDNLKFIKSQYSDTSQEHKRISDMVEKEKLVITPLAYIRGRSLSNVLFIVDEAQNLTPHEVKTIITRAGDNTKIVFTGDIYQIDTPYLDTQSNGLSYLIDRIQDQDIAAHVTLEKGERSELANLANTLL